MTRICMAVLLLSVGSLLDPLVTPLRRTSALALVPQFGSVQQRYYPQSHSFPGRSRTAASPQRLFLSKDGDDNKEWNDFTDLPADPDDEDSTPKLGIPIDLDPLTEDEANQLKAEATELINDKIAQGVDDIRALREDLQKELLQAQKLSTIRSERRTQQESDRLMAKIDNLTSEFMETTEATRASTRLAAKADQNSAGKGVELGSWGVLAGGAAVRMAGDGTNTLLGSVAAATSGTGSSTTASSANGNEKIGDAGPVENRVLIIADESQDTLAKKLLPIFTDLLQEAIPSVSIQTLKPTTTMPLGGDNARCVIVFATAYSDRSGLQNALDRLLRRTIQAGGAMATPPTQLVCVSTIGTERTDKMPYSMQNLMSGGKLEKRRQIEECVVKTAQQRVAEPPLDYTICKVSEKLTDNEVGEFVLKPGDVLDGSTDATTAAQVLLQAVAYQPAARNSTLSVTGRLDESECVDDELWNDVFLRLDGPELLRVDDASLLGDSTKYTQLVEYMNEWAMLLESGQKLTTPIRVEPSLLAPNPQYEGVKQRGGVQLLFLPTKTGGAYMSRDEEKARESELRGGRTTSPSTSKEPSTKMSKKREGGVEVLVEVTIKDTLRVRARRCNMADDTVVKELSEETILKRLQDSIDVWKKQL